MYPGTYATSASDRAAIIMGSSGEVVTYRQLHERSNQFSRYLRSIGLPESEVVAIFMTNNPHFHDIAWGTRQVGRYFTPVNTHLTVEEVVHIVNDSGTTVIVANSGTAEVARQPTADLVPNVRHRLFLGGELAGWTSYDDAVAAHPTTPLDDEAEGEILQYSAGTTGKPKGMRRRLPKVPMSTEADATVAFLRAIGFQEGDTYLSPAPLYHSAPIY